MNKHLIACALIFALAGTADAQTCQRVGLFGRIFRAQCCRTSYSHTRGFCQRYNWNDCSTCQRASRTDPGCLTCPGGACLVDPIEKAIDAGEYKPDDSDATLEATEAALSSIERALIEEANRVRGSVLKFDAAAQSRARYNATVQASYCRLGHFSGDCNEIAGMGYGSPQAAIQGWLNSPAHRAILLRANYTKVGASVRRGRDGVLYWSMNFSF